MGYKIGRIEGDLEGRDAKQLYIVNRVPGLNGNDDYVFYSSELSSERNGSNHANDGKKEEKILSHDDIMRHFGLNNVVAIGEITHGAGGPTYLGIWSGPGDLGAKRELMSNFEKLLLEAYKGQCVGCKDLDHIGNFCPGRRQIV